MSSESNVGWLRTKFVLLIIAGVLLISWFFWLIPSWDRIEFVKALSWPIAGIIGILLFAFQPRLNRVFGLAKIVRKIKAGGVEMEISTDAVDAVRRQLQDSIHELVDKARDEYDRMASVMQIYPKLESVITTAIPRILKDHDLRSPEGLRGTVHVQDIVFPEYLYQLVNYYPKSDGIGRRFSQRYGIIGRSWRLSKSIGEGNAFAADKNEEEVLIKEWGMTREEARSPSRSRPAYLSVLLRGIEDDTALLGVLFLDSIATQAFGDDDLASKIAVKLESCDEALALRKSIERLMDPLRLAAPNIDIGKLSR